MARLLAARAVCLLALVPSLNGCLTIDFPGAIPYLEVTEGWTSFTGHRDLGPVEEHQLSRKDCAEEASWLGGGLDTRVPSSISDLLGVMEAENPGLVGLLDYEFSWQGRGFLNDCLEVRGTPVYRDEESP